MQGCLVSALRGTLKILRDDKVSREFCISGLNKKRKLAQDGGHDKSWEVLRGDFFKAVASALVFLEYKDTQNLEEQGPQEE